MTRLNCDYVIELYPDVLNGQLDTSTSEAVRRHVSSCDECRAAAALLEAIYAQHVGAPAGLRDRVLHGLLQPTARRRFSRSSLTMAATLAATLIGGSVILQNRQGEAPRQTPAARTSGAMDVGFVGVEDAMLSGNASLEDLSVEQLEQLLGEMES